MTGLSRWVVDFDVAGERPEARAAGLPGRDFTAAARAGAAPADAGLPVAGFTERAFPAFALPAPDALFAPDALLAPGFLGDTDDLLAPDPLADADDLAGLDFLDDAITEAWWPARK